MIFAVVRFYPPSNCGGGWYLQVKNNCKKVKKYFPNFNNLLIFVANYNTTVIEPYYLQ